MKTVVRILTSIVAFVISFFVIKVPISLIQGIENIPAIPIVISLVLALFIGAVIWKQTGSNSSELIRFILIGGFILGSIGFVLGFVGPIIFMPTSNQGPMLGIFITGPIGVIVGFVGGGIYWLVKQRK